MSEATEMSEERYKSIATHVKMIMLHQKERMARIFDKKKFFSDYVIDHVIRDFVQDTEKMNGDVEAKKSMAHDIYLQYMKVYEDLYGPNGTERQDPAS